MANYAVDSLQDGCYPGTVVLINILGIQNQSDLDAVEGTIVPAKAALWEEKPLAESFDFAHYCAIHRFLFEDLYEWAGKLRKKNTLGSAVALSEWVKLIRSLVKVYYGRNEVRSV